MALSEVFYMALITTASAFILKLVSMLYKSKCKNCKMCCIEVVRDVEAEIEVDEIALMRQPVVPPNSPSQRGQEE